jgi:nitrate/nitrite transporter NarK
LSVALNALLLPAVTIIGGIVFSVFASIVFFIAEVILIFTFLALVYSENEDERKIPRDMLDWIAEQTIPTMDYIVREWILRVAYYITI